MRRLFKSLSGTGDGAFVIDGRHRIIFWNKAAEALLGYSAEEVSGMQCYEILGGRDDQGQTLCQRYCLVAIQIERGDVVPNRDVYACMQDGERRWVNVTTFAYHSRDKAMAAVIVHLFRDATDKVRQQQFVNQVLSASERLHDDQDGTLASAYPVRDRAAGQHITKVRANNGLTKREWEVLTLLAQGSSTKEMAAELTISPSTVRNHVQNVLNKLGVHSRLEAIAYAYQHGLIESSKL